MRQDIKQGQGRAAADCEPSLAARRLLTDMAAASPSSVSDPGEARTAALRPAASLCIRAANAAHAGGEAGPIDALAVRSRSVDRAVLCGLAVRPPRSPVAPSPSLAPLGGPPTTASVSSARSDWLIATAIGFAPNGGPQEGRRSQCGGGAAATPCTCAPAGLGWQRSRWRAGAQGRQNHAAGQVAGHAPAARGC